MKRLFTLFLALAVVLALTACETATTPAADTPEASATETAAESAQVPQAPSGVIIDTVTTNLKTGLSKADEDDADASWSEADATLIVCAGDTATITGEGAVIENGTLTINKAGDYVLRGTLQGQIVIDLTKEDDVTLILDGFSAASTQSAALWCKQGEDLKIILAENSQNSLSSAALNQDAEEEPSACLFSKCDTVLTGAGSLTVTATEGKGIYSKDDLILAAGTYTVTAADDAIRGKDSLSIAGGTYTLTAGADGLRASEDEDAEKGFIAITDGVFSITAAQDGIQAETALEITGGAFTLVTGGGSANGSKTASGGWSDSWGRWGDTTTTEETTGDSAKGLKAATSLVISGGTFQLDTSDDAIHCNGDLSVAGGTLSLSSGDDGVHADSALLIGGGTLAVTKSYEGLEGNSIEISGGDITVTASDDGVNTSGGSDGSFQRPGANSFDQSGSCNLTISGGTLSVNAEGDGLDANGGIVITGGVTKVSGPTNSGNGALDYTTGCQVTGGTLIATGASGMAQAPDASSTQAALSVYLGSTRPGGTVVTLKGADGAELLSFTPEKDFDHIAATAPGLAVGTSVTLCLDGEEVLALTPTQVITSVDETGAAVSGFGGFGGFGGGQGGFGGGKGGFKGQGDGTFPEPPDGEIPDDLPEGERPSGFPGGEKPSGGFPDSEEPTATQSA